MALANEISGKIHLARRRDKPAVKRSLRQRLRLPLMLLVPLAIAIGAGWWALSSGRYESTDDAFVGAARVSVSTDVAGRVTEIGVRENQVVKAGDLLFRLDDRSFRIAVDEARAALANARLQVESLRTVYQQRLAEQRAAESTVTLTARELERQRSLASGGYVARAQLDQAVHAAEVARQQVDVARQQVASALANLGGDPDRPVEEHPTVQAAAARLAQAELDLSHTVVTAPEPGTATRVEQLQVGDYVNASTPLFYLVSADRVWIDANFKETQLTYLKPGEQARVSIDAYPDAEFAAHVESVSPGTGAVFSLLPPENATGNWVKVTQRLPVRLALDRADPAHPLRAGMSVTATVDTQHESAALAWIHRHFGRG